MKCLCFFLPCGLNLTAPDAGKLVNVSAPDARAKLRLLFEAAPIALIIEASGGKSIGLPSEEGEPLEKGKSLLDLEICDLDQRCGVIFGSEREVDTAVQMLSR